MEYLSVTEVSEETGVTPATLRAMLRDGVLEGYESSGRWIVPRHAVDRLEELLKNTADALGKSKSDAEPKPATGAVVI